MKIVYFCSTNDYGKYYLTNSKLSMDVNLVFGRQVFTKSKILRLLSKIHLSGYVNKIIPLPFRNIWCNKMVPLNKGFSDEVTFLFYTSYFVQFPFDPKYFIDYLRNNYNCRIALLYGNTVESEGRFFDGDLICPLVDLVCSYNTEDVDKYNIKVHPTPCFDIDVPMLPLHERTTDVFFIGQEKGRGEEINRIYNTFTDLGMKCEFYVVGKTESSRLDGIHYCDWIPYCFVVERLKQTKCILNLLWEGSKGVTLRDIEAYNNGCFVLKNYVDESVYELLSKEQILTTDNINKELAEKIMTRDDAFVKKGERKSLDVFYKWIVDNSWNN